MAIFFAIKESDHRREGKPPVSHTPDNLVLVNLLDMKRVVRFLLTH